MRRNNEGLTNLDYYMKNIRIDKMTSEALHEVVMLWNKNNELDGIHCDDIDENNEDDIEALIYVALRTLRANLKESIKVNEEVNY